MKFPLNNGKHGGLWKRAWFNIFCGIFSHHQSQYPLEMKYRQGWCSIRTCINACKSNYDWERMGMISKPKKQLSPTIIDVNSCHWSIRKSCCLWLITIFINSSCLGVTKSPWWMSLLCPFWNWCGMGHAPKNQFWIQTLYVNQIAMFGVPRFFHIPWHNIFHMPRWDFSLAQSEALSTQDSATRPALSPRPSSVGVSSEQRVSYARRASMQTTVGAGHGIMGSSWCSAAESNQLGFFQMCSMGKRCNRAMYTDDEFRHCVFLKILYNDQVHSGTIQVLRKNPKDCKLSFLFFSLSMGGRTWVLKLPRSVTIQNQKFLEIP